MQRTQVLIVGAGPTGLSMAAELERHGVKCRIIDEQIKPVTTSNALAVQTRSLEMWDDMRLLSSALSRGFTVRAANFRFGSHIARVEFTILDSLYPYVLGLSQQQTETMLQEYLKQKNIPIEMPVELVELYEQSDGIVASLKSKNGTIEKVQADWLIACDGGHSFVRSKLNLPFPGKELEEHFVLADIKMESELSHHELNAFLADIGPLLFIPYSKEYTRVIAEVSRDPELQAAKSLTLEQIKQLIAKRCSIPVSIVGEPIWTSGFWIHERIINKYRHNRIFFAGDAAHIHSPAGGQGMNTGMQDAYNLVWKLALHINKKVSPDILVTYQVERYGVAKDVLRNSTFLTRMVAIKNPILLGLRNLIVPMIFKITNIRKKLAMKLTQLSIQYPESMLVQDCMKHQSGPKSGMRMLDVKLSETERLLSVVRGTQFCLLIFSGTKPLANENDLNQLKDKINKLYPDLVKVVLVSTTSLDKAMAIHTSYQVTDPSLYLIRPDKYIGFRGKLTDVEKLMAYLGNIFVPQK